MRNIITILVVLLTFGCSVKKGVDGLDGYDVLKQEAYGGWEFESNEVITSQGLLEVIYKELNISDVPTVDFTKKNVVALFMGQKNTGGYSISIDKMELSGEVLYIDIKRTHPEGMATMALTQPYFIATVPKTEYVKFNK